MPTAYPSEDDVRSYLAAAGITVSDLMILSGYVGQAIEDWERDTHCQPFIATAQVRPFTPEGANQSPSGQIFSTGFTGDYWGVGAEGGSNILPLRTGLLSVNSITTGKTAAAPAGTVKTLGTDFWLYPVDAPYRNRPYTYIKFRTNLWGESNSVSIDGVFGFSATLPQGAFQAILAHAAELAMPTIQAARTGGAMEMKEGDESVQYNTKPFQSTIESWQLQYTSQVSRYKIVRL